MTTLSAVDGLCGRGSARRRLYAGLAALVLVATVGRAEEPIRVSIYAGSRGAGVPEAARVRLGDVERYLADELAAAPGAFRVRRTVVGLEGETMLCIAIDDPARRQTVLARLRSMVASVPLLDLRQADCPVD